MENLNICRINRASVHEQLQNLSDQYLSSVKDEYLNMFVCEAKRIAENAIDDFIHEQEEIYLADEIHRIKDNAKLLSFTDAQKGYRRKMQDWSDTNPIEVTEQILSKDDMPEEIPIAERKAIRGAMSRFGIGTLLAAGLRIVTDSGWAWLLELPTAILSGKAYADGMKKDELKLQQMQEQWAEYMRQNIVRDVEKELGSWFDSAERENISILKSFDIE